MAIQNGTLIKLYDGSTPIALLTSTDMSIEREMLDATNKDSNNWKQVLPGLKSWTFSAELFNDPDQTYNLDDLYAALNNGTQLTMKLSSEITGQKKFTGSVYVMSISKSDAANQLSTISVEFQGTGELVMSTI